MSRRKGFPTTITLENDPSDKVFRQTNWSMLNCQKHNSDRTIVGTSSWEINYFWGNSDELVCRNKLNSSDKKPTKFFVGKVKVFPTNRRKCIISDGSITDGFRRRFSRWKLFSDKFFIISDQIYRRKSLLVL